VAALYEDALVYESGSAITSSGALTAYSGVKTGRSPQDKRIVDEPSSTDEIWWGPVNKKMSPEVSSLAPLVPHPPRFGLGYPPCFGLEHPPRFGLEHPLAARLGRHRSRANGVDRFGSLTENVPWIT